MYEIQCSRRHAVCLALAAIFYKKGKGRVSRINTAGFGQALCRNPRCVLLLNATLNSETAY
jgi:hypothetical protein